MRIKRQGRLAAVATVATLVLAGTAAAALVGLPADGSQVNNDPANGIDPNQDAGVSDVQGGTVVAGNLQVPWAAFEQKTRLVAADLRARLQGRSVGDAGVPGLAQPRPDGRGRGSVDRLRRRRSHGALGGVVRAQRDSRQQEARSSRAASPPPRMSGCLRARNARRGHSLPSLNINTDRDAENPAVTGGAAVAGNDPVPWVAWQELDGAAPARTRSSSHVPSSRRPRGRRASANPRQDEPRTSTASAGCRSASTA